MCPVMGTAALAAMTSMSQAAMFATSLGVSALSTVGGMVVQQQAAEASADAQSANLLATRNAAVASQVRQDGDLHAREHQLKTSTAINLDNQKKAQLRAKGTAAASSESAGLSLEGLMGDFDRQYGNYADSQFQQLGFDMDQMQRQREGIAATTQSRINTVPRTPISGINYFGAAAGMAGAAFSAYDTYSVRDPVTGIRGF